MLAEIFKGCGAKAGNFLTFSHVDIYSTAFDIVL